MTDRNKSKSCVDRRSILKGIAGTTAGIILTGKCFAMSSKTKGSKTNSLRVFKAGAAKVDITPGPDVTLKGVQAGGGDPKRVDDRLHARAIVLDDGATRIAIVVCDVTIVSQKICDRAKELIYKSIGIPTDRVTISATHAHSSVRAVDLGHGPAHDRYRESLSVWIAEAVEKAVGNMAAAKVGWGVGSKPEYCYNRRWIMKPGVLGPNPFDEMTDKVKMYGGPGEDALRTAGPIDPDLSILSLQYVDGRPLALFGNYNIHYGKVGNGVSADFFGHFSRAIEKELGSDDLPAPMLGVISNGTSGNIGTGRENRWKLGNELAKEALRVYKNIEHHDWVPLVMQESELELGVRLPDEKRIKWAKEVLDGTSDKPEHPWRETYARNTLKLAKWPATKKIKFQAIRIGDLGIAAVPTESYAETGLAIKKNSPLKPTFTIGIANGFGGYLPTPDQHKLGGYTTWTTISSYLEINAEPKVRAEVLRLLNVVAKTKI